MKSTFAAIVFTAIAFCSIANGQQPNPVKEPEFNGVFFLLEAQTGELKQLEQQNPRGIGKMRAMGIGGMKITLEMDGEKSPLRFATGQPIVLVVRVSNPREDPSGTIGMTLYQSKGGKRLHTAANVNALGKTSSDATPSVTYEYSRYGEFSLKLLFRSIPVGEWCIGNNDSKHNNCFGIDPADPNQANSGQRINGPSPAGRYARENSTDFIELAQDGTFHLQQLGKNYEGLYRFNDNRLTLVMNNKALASGEIREGVLVDPEGSKWVKQNSQSNVPGSSAETLTNKEIVQMVQAKLPDGVIIAKIRSSVCRFDTSTNGLIKLKQAGVSDAVIQVITEKVSK